MKTLLVVAGNYKQFLAWCAENKLVPPPCRPAYDFRFKYVSDIHDMKGYNDAEVIYYGTWGERKDISEIELEERILKSRGVS